jgi:thiol-disulfide isomerase/thioredoxin
LAGCSLFGKKSNDQPKPFMGSGSSGALAPTTDPAATADNSIPPPGASGLLAGQVIDRSNHRPAKVYIQVVDLQDTRTAPAAKLEVESQQDGYFVVQGLKPGRHYRLIARAKDGDRLLTGTTLAMPPNPRLSILISEENTTPDTPGVPDPPAVPGRAPAGGGSDATPSAPKPKSDGGGSGTPSSPTGSVPSTSPATTANPALIADSPVAVRPPSPPVDVPGPGGGTYIPPAPTPSRDNATFPAVVVPTDPRPDGPTGPTPRPPELPTQVPSCVRVGNKVENFALYDLDGKVWELRRNRSGRLVLLDIWTQPCAPCVAAFPLLEDLHRRYAGRGVEVIGIAYLHDGTPTEQARHVDFVCRRHSIKYLTLLGTGENCPVRRKLAPNGYPTVVLLDAKGNILWHSGAQGFNQDAAREVETVIRGELDGR